MTELFSPEDKGIERQHQDNCRVRKAQCLNSGFAMSFRAFSAQAMAKISYTGT